MSDREAPPDPSKSTSDQIKAALVEAPVGAQAVDFNDEPEADSKEHLVEAMGHLVEAVGEQQAESAGLTGELAEQEIAGTIERGSDPVEALVAARISGLLTNDQIEERAWE